MAVRCCELKWLRYLLRDLRVSQTSLIPLYCDNQAALHIASNHIFHEWTKHNEIDCHFIRDELQAQSISLSYIPTNAQPVDIFTKALGHTPRDPSYIEDWTVIDDINERRSLIREFSNWTPIYTPRDCNRV